MRATREMLLVLLDNTRMQAEIEAQRDDDWDARLTEGKADGIAAALEMLGVQVPPWKPRPIIVKPGCHVCDDI